MDHELCQINGDLSGGNRVKRIHRRKEIGGASKKSMFVKRNSYQKGTIQMHKQREKKN